jgi:RpiB/LacA/LacB family sugar-phosphate isomerase
LATEQPKQSAERAATAPQSRIAVGADHAGFLMKERLREYLQARGYAVEDCGTYSQRAADYPDYAQKVAIRVARREVEWGLLVCGTGVGMAIAANKIPGVRAATCNDTLLARFAREHNNANLLALGSRMLDESAARKIVDTWAATRFAGGRHKQRVEKVTALEQGSAKEKLS